jgi:hypothetical protein
MVMISEKDALLVFSREENKLFIINTKLDYLVLSLSTSFKEITDRLFIDHIKI